MNVIRTGPRGATPLLLLHSAGLDLTYWDQQIVDLSRDRDVVAVDLPGHGASPPVVGDLTVTSMAHVISEELDGIGPRIDVVGLSVGGLVAQVMAAESPDRVRSLTLIDTAAHFRSPGPQVMRARAERVRRHGMQAILGELFDHWFLPRTRADRPDLVDRATKTLLHADVAVHAGLWEAIAAFDGRDLLRRIAATTLVVVGEHDSSSPVAAAAELRDGITGADLVVVPDAAHLSPVERPREVTTALRAFLEQRDDADLARGATR